jgi:ATP-dependent exoDNAse (exonuclease V) beta subunit
MGNDFLVYKAAAGSGKTFNLARIFIEELIRKDENSIDAHLKSIMAITFTHKAANEMKDRVLSFLSRISKGDPNDETSNVLLAELVTNLEMSKEDIQKRCAIALELIMDNFSQLSISTIDSFSHRVVRSFAKELNLHYDFDVSLDQKSWLELAVDRLFDRFGSETKEGKELSKTLIDFFITQFEQGSNWNLKWLLNEFALKNFDDELHDIYKKHEELSKFDLQQSVATLKAPIKAYNDEIRKWGTAAKELIERHHLTADEFYYKDRGVYAFIMKASKGEGSLEAPNSNVLKSLAEDKWEASKISKEASANIERIKAELAHYVQHLVELKEDSKDIKLNVQVLDQIHIMALISFLVKELNLIRAEENILLISDFNLLIADVVKNDPVPFIYERLGERYKHFLLDEFQDTSAKQWHNFVPLFDNAIASKNRNLIVGDGKQAIYRFRGGEVELFSDLPKIYQAEGEIFDRYQENLKREYHPLTLQKNYRSSKAVVDFNNSFFEKIQVTLGGFMDVYKDLKQERVLDSEGYVKCEILSNELLKEEDIYLPKTLESIRECVEDGYRLGDIAILSRNKDKLKAIATYLSENGMDVVSDESLVLKNQEDISLIIAVMNYLVQEEDLQTKYSLYRALIYKYAMDSHEGLEQIDHQYIPLKKKLRSLGIELDIDYLRSLSLLELANEIENIFQLGIAINAYYTSFLDIINDFVKAKGNQLDAFLEHWENIDPSISTPENDKAVKLLTIHKSKGLEYPVVIIPYLDWTKRMTRNYQWVDAPASLELDLPKILLKLTKDLEGSDLEKNYLREKNKSLLDDVNLIYVAFTRAKERLYIYTSDQNGSGTVASEVLTALKGMDEMGEGSVLIKGKREKRKTIETIDETSYFYLDPVRTRTREQNIQVAYEFKKFHSAKMDDALKYGNAVHELFSKIEIRSDLEGALDSALKDGLFNQQEIGLLEEKIDRILKLEHVEDWFSAKGEKYLERELVNADGKLLRPDRIVIDNGSVSVIDYKTGMVSEKKLKKYRNQVKLYMEALRKMSYDDVKGYIIATDEEKIISI